MSHIQPPLEEPETFQLGDDLRLWSVRMKAFLTRIHPQYHEYYILCNLDDPAARRVIYSGVSLSAPPDILWTNLSYLFDTRPPSHVLHSSPNINPLSNTSMFHCHSPVHNFSPTTSALDVMCPDLGTITSTKPVVQSDHKFCFTQAAYSSPDNEVDNNEKPPRETEGNTARTLPDNLKQVHEEAANYTCHVGDVNERNPAPHTEGDENNQAVDSKPQQTKVVVDANFSAQMKMDNAYTTNLDTVVNRAGVSIVISPAGHTEYAVHQTDAVSIIPLNLTPVKTKTSVATANTSGDRHPLARQTRLKVANSEGNVSDVSRRLPLSKRAPQRTQETRNNCPQSKRFLSHGDRAPAASDCLWMPLSSDSSHVGKPETAYVIQDPSQAHMDVRCQFYNQLGPILPHGSGPPASTVGQTAGISARVTSTPRAPRTVLRLGRGQCNAFETRLYLLARLSYDLIRASPSLSLLQVPRTSYHEPREERVTLLDTPLIDLDLTLYPGLPVSVSV